MSTQTSATTSLSIRPFTSSEVGAWSNSYLISGRSEAILFDVFMLASDAAQIADGIARAFAVKTRPVVVHCLTSAIQMSAWRRYTGGESLP